MSAWNGQVGKPSALNKKGGDLAAAEGSKSGRSLNKVLSHYPIDPGGGEGVCSYLT